ncbi:hypothetical protein [Aliivibrio kagoshimensis]|uniref:hypothetical protein n=1 Tax=Aliivibrio kagoshimensis TaxID=2910230 RepID=UPI003D0A8106
MNNIQTNRAELKEFVASLYADGKTPCEQFGVSWEQLSELEKDVPQITCKKTDDCCKTA